MKQPKDLVYNLMKYSVELRPKALEDLAGLEKMVARRILKKIAWLGDNFENITPKTLSGNLKGLFKFRVGTYRVLYSINQIKKLISVHFIGHRKEIYKQKQ